MYGWRARIGNISPTACSEILPYDFYRVAPDGVTFVSTICPAKPNAMKQITEMIERREVKATDDWRATYTFF
jgi:hypothetical protein